MATVTGLTKERMLEIEAASVVGGTIDGSGHLILTRHDDTEIDAGSVIGPTGPPVDDGDIGYAQLAAGQRWEPGDFKWSMQTADHTGWLKMDGRNTLARVGPYAALFAVVGVSLGAGSDGTKFGIGDVSKRVLMGKASSGIGSTLGEVDGAADSVVVEHDHTVDAHNHDGDTGGRSDIHAHDMGHGHTADDSVEGAHTHDSTSGETNVVSTAAGPFNINGSGSDWVTKDVGHAIRTSEDGGHDHDITVSTLVAVTGMDDTNHTHDVWPDSPGTNSPGVPGTDLNLPPFIVMNGFIHV